MYTNTSEKKHTKKNIIVAMDPETSPFMNDSLTIVIAPVFECVMNIIDAIIDCVHGKVGPRHCMTLLCTFEKRKCNIPFCPCPRTCPCPLIFGEDEVVEMEYIRL